MSRNRRESLVILFWILVVVNICWFGYLLIDYTKNKEETTETVVEDVEQTEDSEETEDIEETEEVAEDVEEMEKPELLEETLFYYEQLQGEDKAAYDLLYQGLMEQNTRIMVTGCEGDSLMSIWMSVLMDHPEIFWVQSFSYYEYEKAVIECEIMPNYIYTEEEIAERQAIINEFTTDFVEGISLDASDYEKILYTYETLIKQTDYDLNAENNQHIDSILIDKVTVCAGYAKATKLLLNHLGVECIYVTGQANNGEATESHAWNIVTCEDDYYFVDATWGDPLIASEDDRLEDVSYDYLCCNEDQLFVSHEPSSEYVYPSCTALDWNYYVVNGWYFTGYNAEEISAQIKEDIENHAEVSCFKFSDSNAYQAAKDSLINVHIAEGQRYKSELNGTQASGGLYVADDRSNLFKIYWQ